MAARPTKQVAVTDEVYNEWLQEVKALKPRKQKNWQRWLRNQSGEKTRVCFNVETGDFESYSPAHEARQCKKLSATWVQVVPLSRWRKEGYPVSAVGHAFDVSDEVRQHSGRRRRPTTRATTTATIPSRSLLRRVSP